MQDPLSPFDVVCTNAMFFDPAIEMADAESGDGDRVEGAAPQSPMLDEYRKTRDVSKLAKKPGAEFTRFVCKPLPASFVAAVLDNMNLTVRHMIAFRQSCHRVCLPEGGDIKPPNKLRPEACGTKAADDVWIDVVARRFGLETIYEVGRVIYERARLPEGAHGTGPYYWPGS